MVTSDLFRAIGARYMPGFPSLRKTDRSVSALLAGIVLPMPNLFSDWQTNDVAGTKTGLFVAVPAEDLT